MPKSGLFRRTTDAGAVMAPGTTHTYCIAAISTVGYGREGYISANLSTACATVTVQWESILTGRVALAEDSGGLPVEGAYLQTA